MKKILVVIMALFLVGCEAVTDLIKIQNANKEIESMHIEISVQGDIDEAINLFNGSNFGFGQNLDMAVGMDISGDRLHSVTKANVLGFNLSMETYTVTEEGQRVVYSSILGFWTKSVAEENSMTNFKFDMKAFVKALSGSFDMLDPIDVNGKSLKQMEITMTALDIQDIFGFSLTNEEMTEVEIEEMNSKELSIVLGYTKDTYLIERVEIDLSGLIDTETEDELGILLEMTLHNEVGEIVVPDEALAVEIK